MRGKRFGSGWAGRALLAMVAASLVAGGCGGNEPFPFGDGTPYPEAEFTPERIDGPEGGHLYALLRPVVPNAAAPGSFLETVRVHDAEPVWLPLWEPQGTSLDVHPWAPHVFVADGGAARIQLALNASGEVALSAPAVDLVFPPGAVSAGAERLVVATTAGIDVVTTGPSVAHFASGGARPAAIDARILVDGRTEAVAPAMLGSAGVLLRLDGGTLSTLSLVDGTGTCDPRPADAVLLEDRVLVWDPACDRIYQVPQAAATNDTSMTIALPEDGVVAANARNHLFPASDHDRVFVVGSAGLWRVTPDDPGATAYLPVGGPVTAVAGSLGGRTLWAAIAPATPDGLPSLVRVDPSTGAVDPVAVPLQQHGTFVRDLVHLDVPPRFLPYDDTVAHLRFEPEREGLGLLPFQDVDGDPMVFDAETPLPESLALSTHGDFAFIYGTPACEQAGTTESVIRASSGRWRARGRVVLEILPCAEPRSGGCRCAFPGSAGPPHGSVALAAALIGLLAIRRRAAGSIATISSRPRDGTTSLRAGSWW